MRVLPMGLGPGLVIVIVSGACGGADPAGQTLSLAVDGDSAGACAVAAMAPADGARDVAVDDALTVRFTQAIDAATLARGVMLRTLDAAEVPVDIQVTGPTARLLPVGGLRYFAKYTLTLSGARTASGRVCAGASASFSTPAPAVVPRRLQPAAAHALVRAGDFLVTESPSYRGLQVYRVDAADRVALVGDLVTDVEPLGLRAEGDRAYAPAGRDGVLVFDLSRPGHPRPLPRIAVHGIARDVAPFLADGRRFLAVAESPDGVRILDVTDADAVVDLGVTDPSGGAKSDPSAVIVSGSLLAVANAPSGTVALLAIADPAHPRLLSSTALPREPTALAIDGGVLYAALGFYGIDSFALADPERPVAVAHADGPHGPCTFDCKDPFVALAVDGGRLWAAAQEAGAPSYALDGLGGMTLADVLPVAGSALAVAPEGDHVFVGAEEGLLVFRRADVARLVFTTPSGHGTVRSLSRSPGGGALYAAASVRGVETFALFAPLSPFLVDRDGTPGTRGAFDIRAAEVLAAPGAVYVGDGRAGLSIFAARPAVRLVEVASAPSHDRVEALQRAGDVLFACHDNAGLVIYDVSELRSPREIGHLDLDPPATACVSLQLAGDLLYIGGNDRLGVADVSRPSRPVLLDEVAPTGGRFVSLALAGRHRAALLAVTAVEDSTAPRGTTTRLLAFDLADPVHPRVAWSSDDLGGTPLRDGIFVDRSKAYVAAQDAGVHIFDVAAPLHPMLEGTVATPGSALGVVAGRHALYVAQGEGGLGVISLRPKRCPKDDDDDDGDDDHGAGDDDGGCDDDD